MPKAVALRAFHAHLCVATTLLMCLGCGEGGRPMEVCKLGTASEIARADAVRFDAVALVSVAKGALSVWSELSGTYARPLDGQGIPRAESVRIGDRCAGGIALTDANEGAWLACSRPDANEENSVLVLIELSSVGQPISERTLGKVGRDGMGVAIARDTNRILLAYHDGSVQAYAARLVIVDGDTHTSKLLSDLSFAAGAPSIAARDGHWLAAFSETSISSEGTATRIVVIGDEQPARSVRSAGITDPTPTLLWHDTGPWLAFRDRSPKNPKPELYTAKLSRKLSFDHPPYQVGRANSDGAPSVVVCANLRVALLPREYASERYIGVHGLDARLENLGAGHQYYTNSRDFVLAAGACLGQRALLVTAERKAPADPGASIMALPFACGS